MACRQKRADAHTVYALIAANQATLPVRTMCETLQVSSSGYYDWVDRAPSARQQANEALTVQIPAVFNASDSTYGMLRVRAQLRDDGIKASRKRVARLMRGFSESPSPCPQGLDVSVETGQVQSMKKIVLLLLYLNNP